MWGPLPRLRLLVLLLGQFCPLSRGQISVQFFGPAAAYPTVAEVGTVPCEWWYVATNEDAATATLRVSVDHPNFQVTVGGNATDTVRLPPRQSAAVCLQLAPAGAYAVGRSRSVTQMWRIGTSPEALLQTNPILLYVLPEPLIVGTSMGGRPGPSPGCRLVQEAGRDFAARIVLSPAGDTAPPLFRTVTWAMAPAAPVIQGDAGQPGMTVRGDYFASVSEAQLRRRWTRSAQQCRTCRPSTKRRTCRVVVNPGPDGSDALFTVLDAATGAALSPNPNATPPLLPLQSYPVVISGWRHWAEMRYSVWGYFPADSRRAFQLTPFSPSVVHHLPVPATPQEAEVVLFVRATDAYGYPPTDCAACAQQWRLPASPDGVVASAVQSLLSANWTSVQPVLQLLVTLAVATSMPAATHSVFLAKAWRFVVHCDPETFVAQAAASWAAYLRRGPADAFEQSARLFDVLLDRSSNATLSDLLAVVEVYGAALRGAQSAATSTAAAKFQPQGVSSPRGFLSLSVAPEAALFTIVQRLVTRLAQQQAAAAALREVVCLPGAGPSCFTVCTLTTYRDELAANFSRVVSASSAGLAAPAQDLLRWVARNRGWLGRLQDWLPELVAVASVQVSDQCSGTSTSDLLAGPLWRVLLLNASDPFYPVLRPNTSPSELVVPLASADAAAQDCLVLSDEESPTVEVTPRSSVHGFCTASDPTVWVAVARPWSHTAVAASGTGLLLGLLAAFLATLCCCSCTCVVASAFKVQRKRRPQVDCAAVADLLADEERVACDVSSKPPHPDLPFDCCRKTPPHCAGSSDGGDGLFGSPKQPTLSSPSLLHGDSVLDTHPGCPPAPRPSFRSLQDKALEFGLFSHSGGRSPTVTGSPVTAGTSPGCASRLPLGPGDGCPVGPSPARAILLNHVVVGIPELEAGPHRHGPLWPLGPPRPLGLPQLEGAGRPAELAGLEDWEVVALARRELARRRRPSQADGWLKKLDSTASLQSVLLMSKWRDDPPLEATPMEGVSEPAVGGCLLDMDVPTLAEDASQAASRQRMFQRWAAEDRPARRAAKSPVADGPDRLRRAADSSVSLDALSSRVQSVLMMSQCREDQLEATLMESLCGGSPHGLSLSGASTDADRERSLLRQHSVQFLSQLKDLELEALIMDGFASRRGTGHSAAAGGASPLSPFLHLLPLAGGSPQDDSPTVGGERAMRKCLSGSHGSSSAHSPAVPSGHCPLMCNDSRRGTQWTDDPPGEAPAPIPQPHPPPPPPGSLTPQRRPPPSPGPAGWQYRSQMEAYWEAWATANFQRRDSISFATSAGSTEASPCGSPTFARAPSIRLASSRSLWRTAPTPDPDPAESRPPPGIPPRISPQQSPISPSAAGRGSPSRAAVMVAFDVEAPMPEAVHCIEPPGEEDGAELFHRPLQHRSVSFADRPQVLSSGRSEGSHGTAGSGGSSARSAASATEGGGGGWSPGPGLPSSASAAPSPASSLGRRHWNPGRQPAKSAVQRSSSVRSPQHPPSPNVGRRSARRPSFQDLPV